MTEQELREKIAKCITTNCTVCQIISGKHPPECHNPCDLELLRADQILTLIKEAGYHILDSEIMTECYQKGLQEGRRGYIKLAEDQGLPTGLLPSEIRLLERLKRAGWRKVKLG